jgi:hypothetical protein
MSNSQVVRECVSKLSRRIGEVVTSRGAVLGHEWGDAIGDAVRGDTRRLDALTDADADLGRLAHEVAQAIRECRSARDREQASIGERLHHVRTILADAAQPPTLPALDDFDGASMEEQLWAVIREELREHKGGVVVGPETIRDDGYIESPVDPAAYRPVKEIVNHPLSSSMKLTPKKVAMIVEDYENNRVRWTRPIGRNGKPMQNRRSVHMGDWAEYCKKQTGIDAEGFSPLAKGEVEARKADARKAKQAGA